MIIAIIVLLKDVCYSLKILNIVNEYIPDMLEYGKLNVQTPDRKSSVSRTWGMTYENVFQGTLHYSSHFRSFERILLRFYYLKPIHSWTCFHCYIVLKGIQEHIHKIG